MRNAFSKIVAICLCIGFAFIGHALPSFAAGKRKPAEGVSITKAQPISWFYHEHHMRLVVEPEKAKGFRIKDAAGNTLWLGKVDDLEEIFTYVLPRELDRLFAPALRFQEISSPELALDHLDPIASMLPKNPYVFYLQGKSHLLMRDYKQAIKAFEKSVQVSSNSVDSAIELGNLYYQRNKHKQAIDLFEEAYQFLKNELAAETKKTTGKGKHWTSIIHAGQYYDLIESRQNLAKQNLVSAYTRFADSLYASGKQKSALAQLESAMTLLPEIPGLLETYRFYSSFPPTPAGVDENKADDFSVWKKEIARLRKENRIPRALSTVKNLRHLFPDKDELSELHVSIAKDFAAKLTLREQVRFYLNELDASPQIKPLNKLATTQLKALFESAEGEFDLGEVINLSDRLLKFSDNKDLKTWLPDVYTKYLDYFVDREDFEAAKAVLNDAEKTIALTPELKTVGRRIHLKLAKAYQKKGDLDAVIASYRQAIATGDAPLTVRARLGFLVLKRFIIQNYVLVLTILIIFGAVLFGLNTAYGSYRDLLRLKRMRAEGWEAYQNEKWNHAIDKLSRYVKNGRLEVPFSIYHALGQSYEKSGDLESAVNIYKKISYLFPESTSYLDEARIYVEQGRVTLLLQAIKRSPNLDKDARALIDDCFNKIESGHNVKNLQEIIGSLYLLLGDVDHAKFIFGQVITHYKSSEDVRYSFRRLIEIAKKQKDDATLKSLLLNFEKHYPDEPSVYYELGELFERLGNKKQALAHFQKALKLGYTEELENRIQVLQQNELHLRLEKELERIGDADPSPASRLKIASIKYQLGEYQDAIKECSELIAEGHNLNEAMKILGFSYYYSADYAKAAECLQQHLKNSEEPDNNERIKETRYRLARAYMKQNLFELAIQEFKIIHEVDPNYRDVADKVDLNLTTCPYCSKPVTTQETSCPHCSSRLRGERYSSNDFMLGNNQFTKSPEEPEDILSREEIISAALENSFAEKKELNSDGELEVSRVGEIKVESSDSGEISEDISVEDSKSGF